MTSSIVYLWGPECGLVSLLFFPGLPSLLFFLGSLGFYFWAIFPPDFVPGLFFFLFFSIIIIIIIIIQIIGGKSHTILYKFADQF